MSADEFMQKVGEITAYGVVSVGVALGTKLGLFEGLAKLAQTKKAAVTAQQLADSLGFKERYVREWINGMACAHLIDHEELAGEDRYWLDPYRLPALLGDHLGWAAQYSELTLAAAASSKLIECRFPLDGPKGSEVDDHPEVHNFLSRRLGVWRNAKNFSLLLDADLTSRLDRGIDVLEIGCGAAVPTKTLSQSYLNSRYVATDLSEMNLAKAKENCRGLDNVSYSVLDVCSVPDTMVEKFDLIMMFDVYHCVPYPEKLLQGVMQLLRPGGRFMMNDVNAHSKVADNKSDRSITMAMYYGISTVYCVPTSYNHLGGAALGTCAGMELIEKTLQKSFKEVKRIAKDMGLNFLCTK